MNFIHLIFLSLLLFFSSTTNTLSVKDFGATGNGTTDDTNAINTALAAAHTQAKSLFFPPGTYLCNTLTSGNLLSFDLTGLSNITIYGSGATIKTTLNSASTMLSIQCFALSTGFRISNLAFLNTHGKITGITGGIFETGTSGQNIDTTFILNCKFTGFSQAIGGQGINGWRIKQDSFYSPAGHDCAEQNSDPATYIWFFDNSNGFCTDLDIEDNVALGFSGTLPMSCKRPMDNFIYGTGYGYLVAGNNLGYFSEELIGIQPPTTNPTTSAEILIKFNNLDCSLPPGSIDDNGTPHKSNYGIRVDASNATITENTLINYTWGIMVRGIDFPTLSPHTYNIIGNKFITPLSTDTTYNIQKAVFIQGSSNLITGVNVSSNDSRRCDTDRIQLLSTSGAIKVSNLFTPDN